MFFIITGKDCTWCDKAKEVLDFRGGDYKVVPLEDNPYLLELLFNQGLKTVPQIFHGRQHVGGYEEFLKYLDH